MALEDTIRSVKKKTPTVNWGSYYSSGSSYRPATPAPKPTAAKSVAGYVPAPPAPKSTSAYNVQAIQSIPSVPKTTAPAVPTPPSLADVAMTQTASRLTSAPTLAPADVAMTQTASRLVSETPPVISAATPTEQRAAEGGGITQTIAPYSDVPEPSLFPDQFVGSEQATLGVAYQALADWGLLTSEEMGFLGVQPAAVPSWVLSQQDLQILQNNLKDYGVDPGAVWEIYEMMEINGTDYAVLRDEGGELGFAGGYDYGDGGGGYSGGGYSGGGYSGGGYYNAPGSFRSGYTSGLINWRIGF